jgi:hypothetical protein
MVSNGLASQNTMIGSKVAHSGDFCDGEIDYSANSALSTAGDLSFGGAKDVLLTAIIRDAVPEIGMMLAWS